VFVRVQGISAEEATTAWSDSAVLETGLMDPEDWQMQRIASPWTEDKTKPQAEKLFRKLFELKSEIKSARLYITSQGVYEAEINGKHVGDFFLAPGWTEYNDRLQYQTYDVSDLLVAGKNCIGVRIAEGWYNGRIGFEGGRRNLWGTRNTLMAQLELKMNDGAIDTVVSDASWVVTSGPILLAEIYDGEKYDATKEVDGWSTVTPANDNESGESTWSSVEILESLPNTTKLVAGVGEPVRRIEVVAPVKLITSGSNKTIIDFGQNLVGYVRLKNVRGPRNQKITLTHAEVLEHGEVSTRPLRDCKAIDEYVIRGTEIPESWEPRSTLHGFRYVQFDGWPEGLSLMESIEAVICHSDMERAGHFECSDSMINQFYQNVCWSMRGNFLYVPMDCPQRDERLGWTGDLAVFAPAATFIYQCTGILKNWLLDFAIAQKRRNGIPPLVVPDAIAGDPKWDFGVPFAIWHDVAVLGPWIVYNATGDVDILRTQYTSMQQWVEKIPRFTNSRTPNLWDPKAHQMGVSVTSP
jgi:alpha-L-rhamnosidase